MKIAHIISAAIAFSALGCGQNKELHLELKQGQMLYVEEPAGVALVDFLSYGLQEGERSEYRWRAISSAGQETSGVGVVWMEVVKHKPTSLPFTVNAASGQYFVVAGPIILNWSAATTNSCWLYYQQGYHKVRVLSDTTFKEQELPNH